MNTEGKRSTDDDTSSINEEPSSSAGSSIAEQPMTGAGGANPDMKRSAVKQLIERYFYQLQRGCGNPHCENVNCASSGRVEPMTANEIAAKAIQLFSQDAKLCECYSQPPKVPRTANDSPTSSLPASSSSSSSSSGHSTITSGSNNSSIVSSTTTTSNSSNTNITSCKTEDAPLLDILYVESAEEFAANRSADPAQQASGADEQQQPVATATATAIASAATVAAAATAATTTTAASASASASACVLRSSTPTMACVAYLNEAIVDELLEDCQKYKTYERLLHAITEVYSSTEKLSQSFRCVREKQPEMEPNTPTSKMQELLGKSPWDLKKEDLRTLEGENDKDEDSKMPPSHDSDDPMESEELMALLGAGDAELNTDDADGASGGSDVTSGSGSGSGGSGGSGGISSDYDDEHFRLNSTSSITEVDLESLRRVKKKLFDLNNTAVGEVLNSSIIQLAEAIRYGQDIVSDWEKILHCLIICFDMATNTSNSFADLEYLERSLPKLCHAARILPISAQARMARIWAVNCKDQLQSLVQCCQQLITLQVILDEDFVQENNDVIAVTKVLKIAFFSNLLAGQLESQRAIDLRYSATSAGDELSTSGGALGSGAGAGAAAVDDDDDIFFYSVPKSHYPKFAEDKLEMELKLSCMDCRVPLVPFEEFYNEPLSDAIQMDRDYLSYKNLSLDPNDEDTHFSFMLYSFILTPATKVIALYYDSRIRMYSNSSVYSLLNYFGENPDVAVRPDLKLKVRRENIINDALIALELVAMSNPKDLKKQLVVEFIGEQAIDEGGVSKEFFQLIVEEIFNPDFGMFTQQADTNTVWFNSSPFENEAQFTLIGIILGLAIYNNIILAVNFPMVVYRKLMGGAGTFFDLKDWNPTLHRSLQSMLDYEDSDMEEVFMQTFKICYTNVFGDVIEHELKPGGSDIVVDLDNRQEFVDLYSDYLLNTSIERQFRAFKKGFEMVTDESPLKLLFRPEEIELLVCGSRKFDFIELEKSTEYEGGYTHETQVIKDFWCVVHSMPEESKRKLLEFTTGSDRVPVGGLSRLKLLITRHGPDTSRLPTSHTCFNVLLLPEYSSKEKLEERLLKAINYSKGFGML